MEQQLEDWMELADSEHVPPFLLLLSRSFTTAEVHSKVSIGRRSASVWIVCYRVVKIASPTRCWWFCLIGASPTCPFLDFSLTSTSHKVAQETLEKLTKKSELVERLEKLPHEDDLREQIVRPQVRFVGVVYCNVD
jgi:hypothetical protein